MIVRQRWVSNSEYLEVSYKSVNDQVEVRLFRIDPRKAQYHKVKFWNRGLWVPFRPFNRVVEIFQREEFCRYAKIIITMLRELDELRLTSSDRRAVAS